MEYSTEFRTFLEDSKTYTPSEIDSVLEMVMPYITCERNDKGDELLCVPSAFDTETSSFYVETPENPKTKCATMYIWQFGIFGVCVVGRTWTEFVYVMNRVSEVLHLSKKRKLLCYVHYLTFDFQFFRKWLQFEKVFSLATHEPLYALSTLGIEFRCSFKLSNMSLELVGESLTTYNVRKQPEIDYSKIRHSKTPLTETEMEYCCDDIRVVMAYISECIDRDGGITKIPLTNTGYVRNFVRERCFGDMGYSYNLLMMRLTVEPYEYKLLKQAFQGGFTHANPFHVGKTLHNVTSWDFTSSYPTVMLAERYPMSKGEHIHITTESQFNTCLQKYCCLFSVEIHGLQSRIYHDSYISESRCTRLEKPVVSNGRVVSAEVVMLTITEQDWDIIRTFYHMTEYRVFNFYRYQKGYLPKPIIMAILELYKNKTSLKDVTNDEYPNAEDLYMRSKSMLNSCYGMTVTDIVREVIEYNSGGEWSASVPDLETAIKKYNTSKTRFLFYPWGVWVTAYARKNLFTGILEYGTDYIYADTDSVKVLNAEKHLEYHEKYNAGITAKLRKTAEHYGIPFDAFAPLTKTGKAKPIGVWDFDGEYSTFKTLGAKRYLVQYSHSPKNKEKDRGKISLTVSGVNKHKAVPYMMNLWGETGIFDHFARGLRIPGEYTGKQIHTYIDDERMGYVTDYLGNTEQFLEKTAVHLENSEYNLTMKGDFVQFVKSLQGWK